MAAVVDRCQLMRDIQSGSVKFGLRPTKTVDRSRPILLAEGEQLKVFKSKEQPTEGGPPANAILAATPPPPPPPPPITPTDRSQGKPKVYNGMAAKRNSLPISRDALMGDIRRGIALKKVPKEGSIPTDPIHDQRPRYSVPAVLYKLDENEEREIEPIFHRATMHQVRSEMGLIDEAGRKETTKAPEVKSAPDSAEDSISSFDTPKLDPIDVAPTQPPRFFLSDFDDTPATIPKPSEPNSTAHRLLHPPSLISTTALRKSKSDDGLSDRKPSGGSELDGELCPRITTNGMDQRDDLMKEIRRGCSLRKSDDGNGSLGSIGGRSTVSPRSSIILPDAALSVEMKPPSETGIVAPEEADSRREITATTDRSFDSDSSMHNMEPPSYPPPPPPPVDTDLIDFEHPIPTATIANGSSVAPTPTDSSDGTLGPFLPTTRAPIRGATAELITIDSPPSSVRASVDPGRTIRAAPNFGALRDQFESNSRTKLLAAAIDGDQQRRSSVATPYAVGGTNGAPSFPHGRRFFSPTPAAIIPESKPPVIDEKKSAAAAHLGAVLRRKMDEETTDQQQLVSDMTKYEDQSPPRFTTATNNQRRATIGRIGEDESNRKVTHLMNVAVDELKQFRFAIDLDEQNGDILRIKTRLNE